MAAGYEEERRRRVEQNKKRLKELGISEITKEISKQASKPKKPLAKRTRRTETVVVVRRSSRITTRPNYQDDNHIRLPRRSSGRSSRILPLKYCSHEGRLKAIAAAEKLEQNLTSGNPTTIKAMLQSHVSGGFWLSLPLSFCKDHMPKKDTMMILEDDENEESESLYLAYKNGLSGGWRGFSIDHQLQDGDALVFELTEPERLKVHIVRVADCDNSEKENPKVGKKRKKGLKKHMHNGPSFIKMSPVPISSRCTKKPDRAQHRPQETYAASQQYSTRSSTQRNAEVLQTAMRMSHNSQVQEEEQDHGEPSSEVPEGNMFKIPYFGEENYLSMKQKIIFSASSNNSRRRQQLLETKQCTSLRQFLQETNSFGEPQPLEFNSAGSVPFKWEEQPGKPKSPSSISTSSPMASPLQPPPCLSRDSSTRVFSQQQQASSPALSEKLRHILQLKLGSPKNSEQRSSPMSVLDSGKVFSPESSISSPFYGTSFGNSSTYHNHVESPMSSGRLKKQLSLEIWDRSLQDRSSSSGSCGFFKSMLGCWQRPKSLDSSAFEEDGHVFVFDTSCRLGELESFKENETEGLEDLGDEDYRDLEDGKEQPDEVHTVNSREFAVSPVSAAFVFSKPALKKAGNAPPTTHNKRVRFLIEDYSSDSDNNNQKGDMYDDAVSTEDEGFQRPARSVIRRRRRKGSLSIRSSSMDLENSIEIEFDFESSPDLQPMKDIPVTPWTLVEGTISTSCVYN